MRTIAQYEGADEHLCYSKTLPDKLKDIREKWTKSTDIQEEAKALWYIIHRNVKPARVHIDECRTTTVTISWPLNIKNWNDHDLRYRIILSKKNLTLTFEKDRSMTIFLLQMIQTLLKYLKNVTP